MQTKPPIHKASAKTFWLFGGTVLLGVFAWCYVFSVAWFAQAVETDKLVLLLWCGGATVTSCLAAAAQPYLRVYWSIGFTVPMLAWGLLNAVLVPLNELPILWWTVYGVATATCGIGGALIGRGLAKIYFEKTNKCAETKRQ